MQQLSLEQSNYYPSSLPIRSPSPDTKNANKLNKTISPSVLQIKHQQFTPNLTRKYIQDTENVRDSDEQFRSRLKQSQKNKMSDTFGTQVSRLRQKVLEQKKTGPNFQYESERQNNNYVNSLWRDNSEDLRSKLIQKDRIIIQLKKVLATMSQSEKNRSIDMSYYGNQYELRERIKVLTIQNEKLGEMVRKLNRKGQKQNLQKTITENKSLENKLEFLILENNELEEKIQRFRNTQNEEITELSRANNNLNILLKSNQDKIRGLQKQNERLIKLLKEQRDSQKNLNNNILDQQLLKLQNQNKLLKEKAGPQRLTIVKIKQQYQENLKIFQERVYDEVNKEFQKMYKVIKNLEDKLNLIAQKNSQKGRLIHSTIKGKEQSPNISKFTATTSKIIKAQQQKKSPKETINKSQQQLLKKKSKSRQQIQHQFLSLNLKQSVSSQKQSPQMSELQEKYNALLQQYNLVSEQKKQIEEQLIVVGKQNDKLKEENSQLNTQLTDKQISANRRLQDYKIKSEKRVAQEILNIKQSSKLELERIKQKYQTEVQQIKKNTEQQINRLIDTYNQQITMLGSSIEAKNKDISQINKQIQIMENNHMELAKQKETEIQNLKKQLEKCQQQITQFNNYRKNLEEQSDIRKRSYTELEVKFAFLNDRIEKLTKQKDSLLAEVQSLQDENQTLKNDLHDIKQQNNMIPSLKQKVQSLENELLKLEEKIEQKNQQLKNMKLNNQQLQQRYKKVTLNNNELIQQKNNIWKLINQIEKVKGNFNSLNLEEPIQALTNKLNTFQQQILALRKRLSKSEKEAQSYKKKLLQTNQKMIDYQNQFKLVNLKIQFLTRSNEIKQQQCNKLKKLIDTYINNQESQALVSHSIFQKSQIQLKQLNTFRELYQKALLQLSNIIKEIKLIQNS